MKRLALAILATAALVGCSYTIDGPTGHYRPCPIAPDCITSR